jgi:hypothetical protein
MESGPQDTPLERKFWEGLEKAMTQSQENCLYSDHRLTCERWGGDWCNRFFGVCASFVPAKCYYAGTFIWVALKKFYLLSCDGRFSFFALFQQWKEIYRRWGTMAWHSKIPAGKTGKGECIGNYYLGEKAKRDGCSCTARRQA